VDAGALAVLWVKTAAAGAFSPPNVIPPRAGVRYHRQLSKLTRGVMANWYGVSRSYYVKVARKVGLLESLACFKTAIRVVEDAKKGTAFVCDDGWPEAADVDGEVVEFDPAVHIVPFLDKGEVLVMLQVGNEKCRYLTGFAEAYDTKGNCVTLSLSKIYEMAASAFGVPQKSFSRAEY